jgi:hypothetical protein
MRVIITNTPQILNQNKEARYYVHVEKEKVFPVSVLIIKNHKLIENVCWAPLDAKIVKLNYDFFEDFLLKDAFSTGDILKTLEHSTSTEEVFKSVLKGYSNYLFDYLVKEIYRLDFDGISIYLLRTRRVKASSIEERREKMKELEEEMRDDYFEDRDIPALHVVSDYGEYKVPFDITRDENNEPLNKFVLINEEVAKKVVEEALERNWDWYKYPPVKRKMVLDENAPCIPSLDYKVLYLSPEFRNLVY